MNKIKKFLYTCIIAITSFALYASDVSTTFPTDQTSGQFTLGIEPKTVTFTGGEVRIAGITSLYRSGSRAFMVRNETAEITFGTPAETLLFYIKAQSAGNAFARLLDENNIELLRVEANSSSWTQVMLTHADGIHKVEFTNTANDLAAMEDFEYTAKVDTGPQPPTPIDDPIGAIIEEGSVKVDLTALATGLVSPVTGVSYAAMPNFVYIVDQIGKLYSLALDSNELAMILDVSGDLVAVNPSFDERGLLGFALHPDFANNGMAYTYMSVPSSESADFALASEANHDTAIMQWTGSMNSETGISIDANSGVELLRIEQPQFNHNGGTLVFDQSNMLLISLGDGGSADDQGDGHSDGGNGQDMMKALGKVLRIDPLGNNATNGKYGIPADNPYVNDANVLDEIWISGVRNPYRITVDGADTYICDVGQNKIEEVTMVSGGENLGWPLKEGTFAFDMNGDDDGFVYEPANAELPEGLTDPHWQYDHDEGIAIICGFVYQGAIEMLQEKLIFGDWINPTTGGGRLFYNADTNLIADIPIMSGMGTNKLLGFAQTAGGDVLVLTNETGLPNGTSGTISMMTEVPNSMPAAVASASPASVNEGAGVTLTAANSTDPDGDSLFFVWTQTVGTTVTLSDSLAASPTFTAPMVTADETLTFMVEVSDGHLTDVAEVSVTVMDIPAPPPPPANPPTSSSSGGGAMAISLLLLALCYRMRTLTIIKA
ncbi:PQQ-dependent sugar dehydrogenase [Thalassotalea fusca]